MCCNQVGELIGWMRLECVIPSGFVDRVYCIERDDDAYPRDAAIGISVQPAMKGYLQRWCRGGGGTGEGMLEGVWKRALEGMLKREF